MKLIHAEVKKVIAKQVAKSTANNVREPKEFAKPASRAAPQLFMKTKKCFYTKSFSTQ